MANTVASSVQKILAPLLGEFIAKATVAKCCRAIGTTPYEVSLEHIGSLSTQIEVTVKAFSGDAQAAEIAQKIKNIRV